MAKELYIRSFYRSVDYVGPGLSEATFTQVIKANNSTHHNRCMHSES
jgi:hypothetical protein